MKIEVMSRDFIESYGYPFDINGCYVISISTPGNRDARIYTNPEKILRVSFYDIDKEIVDGDKKYEPISDEQARIIAKFVKDNYDKIYLLFVQCEAGVSRSAGVAAAIAKYYYDHDDFYFDRYVPNRTCYKKVLEALKS